jgi:hypothetical protein
MREVVCLLCLLTNTLILHAHPRTHGFFAQHILILLSLSSCLMQIAIPNSHRSNAQELIAKVPPIEVAANVAMCDGGGGATGHPIEVRCVPFVRFGFSAWTDSVLTAAWRKTTQQAVGWEGDEERKNNTPHPPHPPSPLPH